MGSNPAIPTIWLKVAGRIWRPATIRFEGEARVFEKALNWLGYGLCHQLPERSFFGGGVQVPVCARDTGIYVGFVVSYLVLSALHRRQRPAGFPRLSVWVVMAVLLAAMAFDGVSSYAGLRMTTNELRLATGLGVGFSAAVVVFPMLQDELWARCSRERVLDPLWRFASWIGAMALTFAAVLLGGPRLGVVYPLLVAGAIVATLTGINLVIVAMLPPFDRRAEHARQLVFPVLVALVVSVAEIWLAAGVREYLERLVS